MERKRKSWINNLRYSILFFLVFKNFWLLNLYYKVKKMKIVDLNGKCYVFLSLYNVFWSIEVFYK